MWTDFFDKIYLINLAKRKDRLEQATEQLNRYNIPFERIEAIEHENGADGLRLTMEGIFNESIANDFRNILVFEDDIDIIEPSINQVMENVLIDVPDYDMILLGCQLCQVPTEWYNEHLLKVQSAYATHAVMYSFGGIKKIINRVLPMFQPIDNTLVQQIQPDGKTFAVYPILASQVISHSDIYTREPEQNWKPHLEEKYWNRMRMMQINNNFHPKAKPIIYYHG